MSERVHDSISPFYQGKRVLLTGHTGFKGAWMTKILLGAGAQVCGYSLDPPTDPSLFGIAALSSRPGLTHHIGDIRDYGGLRKAFDAFRPEIVIHLAAQPIVRESYRDPRTTYETNVMGTVNLCECVRNADSVCSFLNVTTDKVYKNNEWCWGYREDEPLDGYDPYSNSKSCSELVTHAYINSFFTEAGIAVSTARAGNVIGGGDFAADRIIPDCVRAVQAGEEIVVRNPHSTRPYQHVLEPLMAYLMIAMEQYQDLAYAGFYNVGPDECDCVTTGEIVEMFCTAWGDGAKWRIQADNGPHEANILKLDCSKLKKTFHWQPRWHIEEAVQRTVEWARIYLSHPQDPAAILTCMESQISHYLSV